MSLVMMSLLVLVIGYGGSQVASGALTAGDLVAFILYLFQVIMPVAMISQAITQLQKARGATESIIQLLGAPEERTAEGIALERVDEAISFRDLHFSYEPGKSVLRSLSFDLEPGSVTAIVGPSGGGKDDGLLPPRALLRARLGKRQPGRQAHRRLLAGFVAGQDRLRVPGQPPHGRHGAGEPLLWGGPGRSRRRGEDSGGRAGGLRRRIHRAPAQGLRHRGGRPGRQALGRPAPAPRDRPRPPARPRDTHARRGDLEPRQRSEAWVQRALENLMRAGPPS